MRSFKRFFQCALWPRFLRALFRSRFSLRPSHDFFPLTFFRGLLWCSVRFFRAHFCMGDFHGLFRLSLFHALSCRAFYMRSFARAGSVHPLAAGFLQRQFTRAFSVRSSAEGFPCAPPRVLLLFAFSPSVLSPGLFQGTPPLSYTPCAFLPAFFPCASSRRFSSCALS